MHKLVLLPDWLRRYQRRWISGDLTAGLIVTVMLIPQSLAYAMLAGLPPQVGLYASVLPLVAYAMFGTSMTLAVGPVAVASLMTASALAPLATAGTAEYIALAVLLALLSGLMLFAAGLLRMGFLAYFLSHPVISGFISGSAVLIAIGQLKSLLGVPLPSGSIVDTLAALLASIDRINPVTAMIGGAAIAFLLFARRRLAPLLETLGLPSKQAQMMSRLAPMAAVIAATVAVAQTGVDRTAGVSVVGAVPSGLPALGLPSLGWSQLNGLWLPALLISLVGFVESVSVAQSLALKRGERIRPDRELLGIGAANIASAVSGGYPVTGGFARSVVNFSAGAHTPAAGVVSAMLMTIVIAGMTGWFESLPHTVLAATIIVAVTALIDIDTLRQAWRYDKADALSLLLTFGGVLLLGVEEGILLGVALSLAVLVWRSSHPHMAVVGRVPGTEHFRNIDRQQVETLPGLIALRIDESLYFANAHMLEEKVESLLASHPETRGILLIMSAVNQLDATALGALTDLEKDLASRNICLQFSEVKGPVLDRLRPTPLGQRMKDRIFLSTHQAFLAFAGTDSPPNEPTRDTRWISTP
ncbi:MAG: sulfate permease [Burkholderiaceae bacterium]|nr:sulfate permease [Burkholderiaceae bacterium]